MYGLSESMDFFRGYGCYIRVSICITNFATSLCKWQCKNNPPCIVLSPANSPRVTWHGIVFKQSPPFFRVIHCKHSTMSLSQCLVVMDVLCMCFDFFVGKGRIQVGGCSSSDDQANLIYIAFSFSPHDFVFCVVFFLFFIFR